MLSFATFDALSRRRVLMLWAGIALASSAHALTTGSGRSASEIRRDLGAFQAIAMQGDIDVVVRQAAGERVQVQADDNLLPLLETVVEDSGGRRTLYIRWKAGESVRKKNPVLVTVDVRELNALATSGSGDVTIEALKTPAFALSISGSSDANLRQLDTERLQLSIAGSGDVQASGRAARIEVSIAGSGGLHARELAAAEVSVSIAGSGSASVTAAKSIGVSIAGSGDVDYSGGALLAQMSIVGSGSVKKRAP